jgi:uncharacterized protein
MSSPPCTNTCSRNDMNILIDIGHPAHVHLYRNLILALKERGHKFWISVKDVPASKRLLEAFHLPYIDLGKKKDTLFGKAANQLKYDYMLRKIVVNNQIDVGLGSSITIPHVSKITRMKSVVLDDDDDRVQPLITFFSHPFCDHLLSPDVLRGKRRKKSTIFYKGYHDLAYLHPRRFIPDETVLAAAGIKPDEMYFVMRFNAFKAHHDIGIQGLSLNNKRQLIDLLKRHGKVFITTEKDIDPEFAKYQLTLAPEKIHSLLYYATMFIGDSQSMTSEAAVLGTPALKCNSFAGELSVPNELEQKYGLCYSFPPSNFDSLLEKAIELITYPNLKEEWRQRQKRMLEDKIDVTAFMVWFVENLPRSAEIMKNDPEYQLRFK